jgi:hypothetical protein
MNRRSARMRARNRAPSRQMVFGSLAAEFLPAFTVVTRSRGEMSLPPAIPSLDWVNWVARRPHHDVGEWPTCCLCRLC